MVIAHSDQSEVVVQSGEAAPNREKAQRDRPELGSNRNSHRMPTAAPGNMCGAKAMVWAKPVIGTVVASRRPRASPPMIDPATLTPPKLRVWMRICPKPGSVNRSVKLYRQTHAG